MGGPSRYRSSTQIAQNGTLDICHTLCRWLVVAPDKLQSAWLTPWYTFKRSFKYGVCCTNRGCLNVHDTWDRYIEAEIKGRHFADDIFKCIFLNTNLWIPINISPKFFPEGPSDNMPALVLTNKANLFIVTRLLIDWLIEELTFGKWAHFWKG